MHRVDGVAIQSSQVRQACANLTPGHVVIRADLVTQPDAPATMTHSDTISRQTQGGECFRFVISLVAQGRHRLRNSSFCSFLWYERLHGLHVGPMRFPASK